MQVSQIESSIFLSAIYSLSIFVFAVSFARILLKLDFFNEMVTDVSGRYGAIDGLRGYLALGVLIHHSIAGYGFYATGEWRWSSSPILNQLGQTTVALFFMITGFLFCIKACAKKINWPALYISRIARLGPLYFLIVIVVFLLVALLSKGVMHEPPWIIFKEFIQWILFVCFGRPDVNAYPMTWTLIAGVNWSLKYEILFYVFGVPLIYFINRLFSLRFAFILAFILICFLILVRYFKNIGGGESLYITHFLGGVLVAYAYQIPKLKQLLGGKFIKGGSIASFLYLMFVDYSYDGVSVLSTIIIFASIVGGASVFGLLRSRVAVFLGDISYGIYLIHGLFVFFVLFSLKKVLFIPELSAYIYVCFVFLIVALVILLSSLSYKKLERPVLLRMNALSKK